MDTSSDYIRMCEKATEIQELAQYPFEEVREGEEWVWRFESTCDLSEQWPYGYTPHVWLPRQDQLQEMLTGHPLEVIERFHTFVMWDDSLEDMREDLLPTSLEQLWLAFIMFEKYGKRWDSEKEEWVKE